MVAELLEKLIIEQTKSRPRKSGDNDLVETKNAAIVRKHVGWGRIAPAHAAPINQFYTGFLNPYINDHRPLTPAEVQFDAKGRKRCLCKLWSTPLETLLETLLTIDHPQKYLRPGLSINALKRVDPQSGRIHLSRPNHARWRFCLHSGGGPYISTASTTAGNL